MAHMTNPLATVDQLYRRAASFGALPADLQDAIFVATQSLTQAAGLLLRLPQSVTAQASVVLARYWLEEALLAHEFSDVSAAALFLTAKLSAHPVRPRDLANVYAYLRSQASPLLRAPAAAAAAAAPLPTSPDTCYYVSESALAAFRARILALESRILCALGFDTHVALPHALAITYLQALGLCGGSSSSSGGDDASSRAHLARRVVAYLNTALLSPQLLYLTHQPNALAVAAIYSAARDPVPVPAPAQASASDSSRPPSKLLPECPWWEVFDVDREELGFLVVGMRSLDGLVRKLRVDFAGFGDDGVVTRAHVEAEMARRGLKMGNGVGAEVDEEEAMMRSLDERAARMEE
ncbi:putative cyclin domain-containing protein [Rosellinia necatrix]|uniref:Putative cyclin domain-containing protein n=1 Tax=Rosellinia necatrix TaxID=77044 RepID=A0A1W2TV84_ROSNE|nr:putative cyclin domain-containing protein [Rosellinia necatrix]